MLYSTFLKRDETGLNQIFEAACEFEEQNVLDAIVDCKFSMNKVAQTLNHLRICQAKLNNESIDLVEFSEKFIESYATDYNECFRDAEKLIRRIGTTITGSMKLFRKFCPVVRRVRQGSNVVPVLDYSRLTYRHYHGQFFGEEAYPVLVKTFLHELAYFFHYLVLTLKVCKDMIHKEKAVRGDYEMLKQIYEKSCDEALHSVLDVFDTFGQVKLMSDEELERRRRNARPMKERLPKDYHAHDRKWMKREAYVFRLMSAHQYGFDSDLASILWAHNPEWGRKVCDIIPKLDTLRIPFKKSKKASLMGKKGTFNAREMVYLVKWSGVSWVNEEGKLVKEVNERHFYENYLRPHYNGEYLLPTWQAVCAERKFLYDNKISMEEMASCFAKCLSEAEAA